ncbi:MAG: flagellar hook-length control protein FliK [Proteobacteria bacterium]|nr:flagellar hook-length control protein FliK [Pseudomonadota bacterium]
MLNISIAPQVLSSADNPAAAANSGSSGAKSSGAKDPATEDFGKVLDREVSETTNKQEKNDTAAAQDPSNKDATAKDKDKTDSHADASADGTDSFIQNLLNDASATFKTVPSLQAMGATASPDATNAASALPQTATAVPPDMPLPQNSEQITSAVIPAVNQLLQQGQNQADSDAISMNSSSNNYWQFLGTADSAAYGKFVPPAAELSEDTQLDNAAPILKTQEEPMASQPFSLSNTTVTASQSAAPQDVKVDAPVGQHKWGGEFAQKVVWLSSQQHQVAEIRLNPAHLGPVEVMLSITQDQATAQFVSPHSAVRDAIQEALPRLREMMAENGIQLGNVMVGADSFQQENKQQQAFYAAKGADNMNDTTQEVAGQIQTAAVPIRHQGLVNTYA